MVSQLVAFFRQGSQPAAGHRQEAFARVAPLPGAALTLGAGGGFVFATILTITRLLNLPEGLWWSVLAQTHGHLQLYGWAGLFVLGVALHFLPRLRGAPLAFPQLLPWFLAAQVSSLLLRALCQPLAAISSAGIWPAGLVISGLLEVWGLGGILLMIGWTFSHGPALASRPAFTQVLPLFVTAFAALALAALVNLVNMFQVASSSALIPATGDTLDVTLGLLGFLVPMALAMSARALPMYAGLEAFPRRLFRLIAAGYIIGLLFALIAPLAAASQLTVALAYRLAGAGTALVGLMIGAFVLVFIQMMRKRSHLPARVVALAPEPEALAGQYRRQVKRERGAYGPFVALVASAYLWALIGGLLLVLNGLAQVFDLAIPVSPDAARHSLALGFIALLIAGIAPRMLPGFSGGHIRSPGYVTATLWLGNTAAVLRVGSLLVAPLLAQFGQQGSLLDNVLFGLSGPAGLAFAICLAVNLWPAIFVGQRGQLTPADANDHDSTP